MPWASGAIGLSHESRGGLACHFLRDASTLAVGLPLHIIEAEDPVGELGHGFKVPVQYSGVQEDGRLRPGRRGSPYPWPFRNADAPLSGRGDESPPGWSTARTEVKALLTSSSTMSSRSSRLRMPERMPVIKRILICCRWGLPFRARSISSGGERTVQGSR